MLDIKRLRHDPDGSRASLLRRGDPALAAALDGLLGLDRRRRELVARVETLKAERNAASDEVARRKRAKEPADELMARLRTSGDEVKSLDARLREIETALDVNLRQFLQFQLRLRREFVRLARQVGILGVRL